MRSMKRSLFLVAAGLILASPVQAKPTQQPHPINKYFHNPLDLSVEMSLAPKSPVQNEQVFVVTPPRPLDPSLLTAPGVVRWPTVYRLEWERMQGQYIIAPDPYAKK
jgi:hypothetical protein